QRQQKWNKEEPGWRGGEWPLKQLSTDCRPSLSARDPSLDNILQPVQNEHPDRQPSSPAVHQPPRSTKCPTFVTDNTTVTQNVIGNSDATAMIKQLTMERNMSSINSTISSEKMMKKKHKRPCEED
uniref:Uncharacterized protein n=1 Tax=Parascaris univalens TaxID=6257 RepID=A0A915CFF1_PARUN